MSASSRRCGRLQQCGATRCTRCGTPDQSRGTWGTATGKTLTGVNRPDIAASAPPGPPLPPVADILRPRIKDFPEKTEKDSDGKIAYYAMFDIDTSRERPRGVFRRVSNAAGETDEIFSRPDLQVVAAAQPGGRGDTMFDFAEISQEEADQIACRIRANSTTAEQRSSGK